MSSGSGSWQSDRQAGTVDSDSHVVKCGALSPDEMDALRQRGAAIVIVRQIIDAKPALDCSYNRRIISADLKSPLPYRNG